MGTISGKKSAQNSFVVKEKGLHRFGKVLHAHIKQGLFISLITIMVTITITTKVCLCAIIIVIAIVLIIPISITISVAFLAPSLDGLTIFVQFGKLTGRIKIPLFFIFIPEIDSSINKTTTTLFYFICSRRLFACGVGPGFCATSSSTRSSTALATVTSATVSASALRSTISPLFHLFLLFFHILFPISFNHVFIDR